MSPLARFAYNRLAQRAFLISCLFFFPPAVVAHDIRCVVLAASRACVFFASRSVDFVVFFLCRYADAMRETPAR
jgi:hypothetical protein